jgi:hypothetical protein
MEGLRDLYVVVSELKPGQKTWERGWLENEERLMQDVVSVGRASELRRAVVVLPYEGCRVDWEGQGIVVFKRPGVEDGGGMDGQN